MAWIKMRTDLDRDPAVIQLAEHYGCHEHVIVGLLHKLWSWADEQLEDGNAVGVTYSYINRYLGVTDFAQNLERVGWLHECDGNGIGFPNWDRHMGQSAKTRATTALRVAKSRAKTTQECNGATVTKTLPEKIREEKIREEGKEIKAAKPRVCFLCPTVEDVREYCQERSNKIDPEQFCDYYETRGWKLRGGQAMKDWKAAVRTWERSDYQGNGKPKSKLRLPGGGEA